VIFAATTVISFLWSALSRCDTTGNQYVDGPGIYPNLRVDDFELPRLDLLYLDVESEEKEALLGGARTILRCKPVWWCLREMRSMTPTHLVG